MELCAPVMAVLALRQLLSRTSEASKKMKSLKISVIIVGGLGVLLFVFKGAFDFIGPSDDYLKQNYGDELVSLIQADRRAVYNSDLIRSLIYVLLTAAAIWLYIKGKLKENIAIGTIGLLIVFDLVGVGLRYVDGENFVAKRRMTQPFTETVLDKEIKKDEGVFRVYNPSEGINGARTSFYHQSIGGYHAAKPAALEDLFSFHIYKGNLNVLNMLNVKYVVQQDEEGRSYPALNPDANGNAWFVSKIKKVEDADAAIMALENLDTKVEAVINTAEVNSLTRFDFQVDSLATIKLSNYEPNHLTYTSNNSNAGVAVFSEMYYPQGWNAYIDGQLKEHFKVNYSLRALRVPEGEHTIEFKFEPEVVQMGSQITLASSILLALAVLGGLGLTFYKKRKPEENAHEEA